MAAASYDQLLKQVEALKMENSNLRQELEDNSNHLTKLETEASNMKEVLKQLQGSIGEESMESSGQIELLERLKEISLDPGNFSGAKLRSKASVRLYDSCDSSASGRSGDSSPVPVGSFPRRGVIHGGLDSASCLEELEKERSLLMAELEKEEKEKDWYYTQLQNLTKRIDSLPLMESFSLQTDMTRRQLEYEARQIRAAMEEQLGTCQDMEKRAQVRVSRIQQIEKDIVRIRQRLQPQPADSELPMASKQPALLDCERDVEGGQASGDSAAAPSVCSQGSSSRGDLEAASDISCAGSYSVPRRLTSHLGTKVTEDYRPQVEMVYSLLSMLGTHDKDDMSRTLLAMSSSQDSCIAMRQSGCLPLLIQLLHGNDKDSVLLGNSRGSKEARARASAALHNIIHSQPDDKRGRREIRVLHLLEQIRAYCETCWEWQESHERGVDQDKNPMPSPVEHQICPAVCVLMKLSFDEEHRHAMNELGGLQAIGELLQVDCEIYGLTNDHYSVTLRRYAGMALTNLTFGDVANKATLCSMKGCMRAMVAQLKSDSEDLQQVIASVLRNLSWRADVNSKKTLREVGSVKCLMECALDVKKESTLKSVLSALWNLSAHCTENKADICAVSGALAFLVSTLTYQSQTNTLAIIESGGGILRNVSSLIATNEDYRQILRENNCLQTLLQHLKSHSLTIVSNACGTLWNLSARNAKDQEALWDMGAVSMLKNLIHSKHKMIAMGSAAALRNLMANRPAKYKDANIMSPGSSLPSLHARKQKALIEELDAQHLSETFDNIDNLSPKTSHKNKPRHKQNTYSEFVLDSGHQNDDSVSRSDTFNPNAPLQTGYANVPVLPNSSPRDGRGSLESSKSEKDRSLDRERRGVPTGFHSSDDISKRTAIQASSTTAQIAKVMEETESMCIKSPSRLPINKSGTWKREHSKHSSSLPRVSTWKRTGSSSSILSASSESSEKTRSEDERQTLSPHQKSSQHDASPALKGTWRKFKESEIPHLMDSETQDTLQDEDCHSAGHQMVSGASKSEDVWVRIEDCPINNPRSGKSPTGNVPPVICSMSDNVPAVNPDASEAQSKQFCVKVNSPAHALEKKVPDVKPTFGNACATPETHDVPVTERTPFSSSNSSKHSSPSGAVAARVTPFNYNPSPRKSSADGAAHRPSQIPTPVTSATKKRDSKGENAEPSGSSPFFCTRTAPRNQQLSESGGTSGMESLTENSTDNVTMDMWDDNYYYFPWDHVGIDALPEPSPLTKVAVFLYCLTCVLGLPGNGFVLWIAGMKMKKTVNTTWFLNLAIADFLCCLSVPFSIADVILDHRWPYGDFLCRLIPGIVILNMFASVFILTLISVDRFLQVIKPVWSQNHRTIAWASWLCGVCWVLALALSLPSMVYRQVSFNDIHNRTVCEYDTTADQVLVISVVRFVFGFLLPIVVIVMCYSFILHKVNSSQFSKSQKSLKIILGVIVAFFACWLPYHVVGLMMEYGGEASISVALYADPLAVSLAYFNSCLNPLLYVFMGQDFKKKVKLSLARVLQNVFSEAALQSGNSISPKGEQSRTTNTSEAQA
ncbi:adenomatous polyposis coli protein isoform X1 [Arapaima gigas]